MSDVVKEFCDRWGLGEVANTELRAIVNGVVTGTLEIAARTTDRITGSDARRAGSRIRALASGYKELHDQQIRSQ